MNFAVRSPSRPKVCFLFIGHRYQILHGVSIAAELSLSGLVDVHIAGATAAHVEDARGFVDALGSGPVSYHRLWPERRGSTPKRSTAPKAAALALNLDLLRQFDAIVAPERTSLLLKKFGVRRPLYIHTDHGAGDRAVGFEPRIAQFDLVLLAGEKQRRRMTAANLIREGDYAVVGYSKFDLLDRLARPAPRLFPNSRPTVLYNPHFHPTLSSWRRFGRSVLEQFAASPDYNLVFAPHMRLFDRPGRALHDAVQPFQEARNIHIDLGGTRSCDMTYTQAADIYLGDVSSQVYEFIRTPRPCLFLNSHDADWVGDENYAHWRLGPVLDRPEGLCAAVRAACHGHADYVAAQRAAFAATFDLNGSASGRAAKVILNRLMRGRAHSPGPTFAPAWDEPLTEALGGAT